MEQCLQKCEPRASISRTQLVNSSGRRWPSRLQETTTHYRLVSQKYLCHQSCCVRMNNMSTAFHRTMGCHLPYGITQRCMPLYTTEHSQTGWYSINLPRRDGRLSSPVWLVSHRDGLPVSCPSSNWVKIAYSLRDGVVVRTSDLWSTGRKFETLPCTAGLVLVWNTEVKLRRVELLMKLHLRSTGCHMPLWDHTVLPSIWHKWKHPVPEAGTRFTYPRGTEGWVHLRDRLHTEMVYPPTDGHPNKY